MKTLIISSSLSPASKSYLLCEEVAAQLISMQVEVTVVDARDYELNLFHQERTEGMQQIEDMVSEADNIIIGMGVHCYSINDGLKVILDGCFKGAMDKFYGILCATGGERSYLSTMHLTQICQNEWRMIQLPRTVVATGADFSDNKISNTDIIERLNTFVEEFENIGQKLI